jgi:hypothetical protein
MKSTCLGPTVCKYKSPFCESRPARVALSNSISILLLHFLLTRLLSLRLSVQPGLINMVNGRISDLINHLKRLLDHVRVLRSIALHLGFQDFECL